MSSLLCGSIDLEERGRAVSFRVQKEQRIYPAFVVRADGVARGYLNACAHVGLPLDGRRGQFWYLDGTYLGCVQHGAIYEPNTGLCVRGPCEGLSLIALNVVERDDNIYLEEEQYLLVTE
ncbi:MAG: Rieske 2Fe-2S domain-containing protein [Gammaproteobacteria bacterium]|nr:Rieske 2Fe-2S domain-containing protein [Gammaproteobacteria bacterium]